MKISLMKHLKTVNPSHLKLGCADGNHHLVVVTVESSDAFFQVFYKNQDTPYKVKQTSGGKRDLTEQEFEASNQFCHDLLLDDIQETLSKVEIYNELARLIDAHTGHVSYKHNLLIAVKVHKSDSYNEMHYHLSNMIKATDAVIDKIIVAANHMINGERLIRYN